MAGIPGVINDLDQPLYYRAGIPASANTLVSFFTAASGDKQVTNVASPRQLPGANRFDCWALRMYVHPLGSAAGVPLTRIEMGGIQLAHLEFKVDDVVQFETLCLDCPGAAGMGGFFVDGAAEDTCLLNGSESRLAFRRFNKAIKIGKGQQFEVNLKWNTAFTPTSAAYAICFLDGVYIRRAL